MPMTAEMLAKVRLSKRNICRMATSSRENTIRALMAISGVGPALATISHRRVPLSETLWWNREPAVNLSAGYVLRSEFCGSSWPKALTMQLGHRSSLKNNGSKISTTSSFRRFPEQLRSDCVSVAAMWPSKKQGTIDIQSFQREISSMIQPCSECNSYPFVDEHEIHKIAGCLQVVERLQQRVSIQSARLDIARDCDYTS